jgi:hypothetical protein
MDLMENIDKAIQMNMQLGKELLSIAFKKCVVSKIILEMVWQKTPEVYDN